MNRQKQQLEIAKKARRSQKEMSNRNILSYNSDCQYREVLTFMDAAKLIFEIIKERV